MITLEPDGQPEGLCLPGMGLPGMGLPGMGLPGMGLPGMGLPGMGLTNVWRAASTSARAKQPAT
jgi:hypothetical protein